MFTSTQTILEKIDFTNWVSVIIATIDGSILSLLPIAEKPFRRLMMLQNKLVDCMQHRAGLNPRAFR